MIIVVMVDCDRDFNDHNHCCTIIMVGHRLEQYVEMQ